MRITQSMMTRRYLNNLNTALGNVARSNQRIASGRKFEHVSENVTASVKSMRVRENISASEMYIDSMKAVDNELASAESNLMAVLDNLTTVKEKIVKVQNSATIDADSRENIADEIRNLQQTILKTVNTKYDDKYIFGGTNTHSAPFAIAANGTVTYNGADVSKIYKDPADGNYYLPADPAVAGSTPTLVEQNQKKYLDIGLGMTITNGELDPNTAFEYSFSGLDIIGFGVNEKGESNNIIALLGEITNAIAANGDGEVYDKEKVGSLLDQFNTQFAFVDQNVTDMGTRTSFLTSTTNRYEDDIVNMKALHKRLFEIDEATEITNQKMYEFSWNAILNIGSKVIPASLMDFVR